jgi:oligoribonuclease
MTGLEVAVDEICEIGVVVTDGQLNVIDPGLQLVIKPSEVALQNMGDFVRQMHTDSGLIEEIPQGITISQAEQQVLDYIKQWVTEERTAPLAGNSIGTDRMFLNRQMPQLDKYLHYRNIDVSSLKELTRRWFPRVYFQLPKKTGNHRALADILESIQELRYYRKAILVEEPGPDSETAKGIANSLSADRI